MIRIAILEAALGFLFPAIGAAQLLSPPEALDRFLINSSGQQTECADSAFDVQIDASLPKLGRHGKMSGLKLVAKTGQIAYRSVRITGDSLVKTVLIARFLNMEAGRRANREDYALNERHYSFAYQETSDYNGLSAYVFRLRPKRKRQGLVKGELWLNSANAAPLRVWGDFVKSPSVFIRSLRVVQDYQASGECSQPLRLLVMVRTRVVGDAEMTVWSHSVNGEPIAGGTAVAPASVTDGGTEH